MISEDTIFKIVLYIFGIAPVLITQILVYDRLKVDVANLKKSVDGIGGKVNLLKDKVGESMTEEILRYSDLKDRVASVEGELKAIEKFFSLPKPNGHA